MSNPEYSVESVIQDLESSSEKWTKERFDAKTETILDGIDEKMVTNFLQAIAIVRNAVIQGNCDQKEAMNKSTRILEIAQSYLRGDDLSLYFNSIYNSLTGFSTQYQLPDGKSFPNQYAEFLDGNIYVPTLKQFKRCHELGYISLVLMPGKLDRDDLAKMFPKDLELNLELCEEEDKSNRTDMFYFVGLKFKLHSRYALLNEPLADLPWSELNKNYQIFKKLFNENEQKSGIVIDGLTINEYIYYRMQYSNLAIDVDAGDECALLGEEDELSQYATWARGDWSGIHRLLIFQKRLSEIEDYSKFSTRLAIHFKNDKGNGERMEDVKS